MCLTTIQETFNGREAKVRIGYKVMNGGHKVATNLFQPHSYHVGVWYETYCRHFTSWSGKRMMEDKTITSSFGEDYRKGFHIYTELETAKRIADSYGNLTKVYRVKYARRVAKGKEGFTEDRNVVVALDMRVVGIEK